MFTLYESSNSSVFLFTLTKETEAISVELLSHLLVTAMATAMWYGCLHMAPKMIAVDIKEKKMVHELELQLAENLSQQNVADLDEELIFLSPMAYKIESK